MGRAEVLFAACAVAVALLAGTACAIASADPADTSAGESTNETTSGDERQSANEPTVDDANTYSGDNDKTGGEDTTGGEEESGGDRADDDNADDSGAPDGRNGRTANKMPSKLPEAPPVDILPLPEELPPLPLEPPLPPADLPPGEPDAVDVTMVGPGASQSARNESPAIKLPAIIAPPALPGHILGTSITARGISRPPVTSPSRGSGEPLPSPRQPTTGLRGLPVTSAGLSGPGQTAYRTGYNKDGLPRVRWLEMAAGALPGIGGMIVMTAAGVCLGYRQATAAQRLQAYGVDRFLT
jgi:hypothetical protein